MDLIFQVFDEVVPRDGDDRAEERDPGARHHHRRRHGHEHPPQGRQNDHQEQRPGQLGDDQYSRQQHPVILLKLRIMKGLTQYGVTRQVPMRKALKVLNIRNRG